MSVGNGWIGACGDTAQVNKWGVFASLYGKTYSKANGMGRPIGPFGRPTLLVVSKHCFLMHSLTQAWM